jgi:histidyl-tRNA synthetase
MLTATSTPSRAMLRAPQLRALLRRPAAAALPGAPATWRSARAGRASFAPHAAGAASAEGGRPVTTVDPNKPRGTGGKRAKMIDLQPPKGTRDFPPEEMRVRNWLFGHFRDVARSFGFDEFDAPVLETEELYVRKAGEEITQQLYNFEDKGNRRVALRPELTPSFARLILQQGKSLALPAKWFAVGQCWRYERMTRGRRREHYQWNMDIVGVEGVEAEAELLAAITTFFARLGITSDDVGLKISSRKVLQAVLARFDVSEENFAPVCVVVDKIDKLPREKIVEELEALGVDASAIDGILAAMELRSIEDLETLLGADADAVAELRRLFSLADAYGYADWLVFDASVVRGLSYYTGVVFEGFDRAGELRAICGGGRYDKLLSALGGEDRPMVGFGFGDAVIMELVNDRGLLPESLKKGDVDDLVFPMSAELRPAAMALAARLRASGRAVDLVIEDGKKPKWAFKHAERSGAKRVVLLGEKEWENGMVRVKNLETREEEDVKPEDLVA